MIDADVCLNKPNDALLIVCVKRINTLPCRQCNHGIHARIGSEDKVMVFAAQVRILLPNILRHFIIGHLPVSRKHRFQCCNKFGACIRAVVLNDDPSVFEVVDLKFSRNWFRMDVPFVFSFLREGEGRSAKARSRGPPLAYRLRRVQEDESGIVDAVGPGACISVQATLT